MNQLKGLASGLLTIGSFAFSKVLGLVEINTRPQGNGMLANIALMLTILVAIVTLINNVPHAYRKVAPIIQKIKNKFK